MLRGKDFLIRTAIALLLVFSGFSKKLLAQPVLNLMNHQRNISAEEMALTNSDYFSSVKPYIQGISFNHDSLIQFENERFKRNRPQKWMGRKLKNESLWQVDSGSFRLRFDPLFHFEGGRDSGDSLSVLNRNTRGVQVWGSIGEKVAFHTVFLENQALFPAFVRDYIARYEVVPGEGRAKPFKTNGSDFAFSTGTLSFQPLNGLYFQLGHGKTFIGNGYRSMLISDNAFNMPYVQSIIKKGKFFYLQNWSMTQTLFQGRVLFNPQSEPLFRRGALSYQYAAWRPQRWVEIGLFSSTLWKNSNGYTLVPLPVFSTFAEGTRSVHVNGINFMLSPLRRWMVYGQLAGERFNDSKLAFQLGSKLFIPFSGSCLTLQAEVNYASESMYLNPDANFNMNGFAHYNQALAHPVGTNFSELVLSGHLRVRDFWVMGKAVYAERGLVSNPVRGNFYPVQADDVFISSFRSLFLEGRVGYLLNPSSNLNVSAGFMSRDITAGNASNYVFFAISTSLFNQYFDF
jgi:hypothetical protein